MASKRVNAVATIRERRVQSAAAEAGRDFSAAALSAEALDDRIAIVGTAGSGKTYAAKGFVETTAR